jgi:hypothetical protein
VGSGLPTTVGAVAVPVGAIAVSVTTSFSRIVPAANDGALSENPHAGSHMRRVMVGSPGLSSSWVKRQVYSAGAWARTDHTSFSATIAVARISQSTTSCEPITEVRTITRRLVKVVVSVMVPTVTGSPKVAPARPRDTLTPVAVAGNRSCSAVNGAVLTMSRLRSATSRRDALTVYAPEPRAVGLMAAMVLPLRRR